jgi:ribosomal protein S25
LENFIGISREISEHWIYKDSQYFHVWFEMLRCARYSKEPKNDIEAGVVYTINYAEFMFGYPSWSRRLKIGEQRLRTLIKLLIKDNMIVQIKKHPKFTIYFIVNYEKYNNLTNNQRGQQTSTVEGCLNNLTNNQPTTCQQPPNNLLTTKEEGKERSKKDKKDKKDIYVFHPPTLEQVKEYCKERNNSVNPEKWYDFYSSKGWMVGKNKMKDWKAAVRTWEHDIKPKEQSKSKDLTNYDPNKL